MVESVGESESILEEQHSGEHQHLSELEWDLVGVVDDVSLVESVFGWLGLLGYLLVRLVFVCFELHDAEYLIHIHTLLLIRRLHLLRLLVLVVAQ